MEEPIFIHGILRRSGTNFLNQLLLLHSKLVQPDIKIRENWFLNYAHLLDAYVEELDNKWSNPRWGGESYEIGGLYELLGRAQLNFLNRNQLADEILISKTPSFNGLDRFNKYFKGCRQILVVRNPFDVSASTFKTWGTSVQKTILDWQQACFKIIKWEQEQGFYIVRYEDLIQEPHKQMEKILNHFELNSENYKWDSIMDLPVFGSSDDGDNWRVKEKESGFRAISKWKSLSDQKVAELKANSEEQLNAYFGYDGYLETGEIKKLPSSNDRQLLGKVILQSNEIYQQKPKKKSPRKENFKNGLKLILKSIKP